MSKYHKFIMFDNLIKDQSTSGRAIDGTLDGTLSIDNIDNIRGSLGSLHVEYLKYVNIKTINSSIKYGDVIVYGFNDKVPFLVAKNITIPIEEKL